jgi:hypothetical protein
MISGDDKTTTNKETRTEQETLILLNRKHISLDSCCVPVDLVLIPLFGS